MSQFPARPDFKSAVPPGEPIFVNQQGQPVIIFDEDRRQIIVMPLALYKQHQNGTFQVHGEFYRQFEVPKGGLTLFRPENHPADVRGKVLELVENQDRQVKRAGNPPLFPPGDPRNQIPRRNTPTAGISTVTFTMDTATVQALTPKTAGATREERAALAQFIIDYRSGKEPDINPTVEKYSKELQSILDVRPGDSPASDPQAQEPPPPFAEKPPVVTQAGEVITPTSDNKVQSEEIRKAEASRQEVNRQRNRAR